MKIFNPIISIYLYEKVHRDHVQVLNIAYGTD